MRRVVSVVIIFFSLFRVGFCQDRQIPSEKPKLVVGIVVSEMRYDYIFRYWDKFGEGGIKRLVNSGTFCKNTHHDYLNPGASAGFASISTGAYPDAHGIVSDFWYDRLKDKIVYSIYDENAMTLGGAYTSGHFSPVNFQAGTLSDEVRIHNKFQSKVVSVSMDPRAAIASGGHTSTSSYWFDDETGKWISSSYFQDSLPGWVNSFNTKGFGDLYLQKTWEPLLPAEKYSESLEDDNSFEEGFHGKKTFPYDLAKLSSLKRDKVDYSLLKATPFGDTYTRDMAVASIVNEKLGKDDYTDFLFVNFSSGAFAGDFFHSWSVEMEDIYLRFDRELEHFLDFLDKEIGLKNVLIYLTADNAAVNDPGYLLEKRIPSGFFNYNSALSLLKTYLNVIYGKGDWVKFYYSQQIYLNSILIEDSKIPFAEFEERVARFMVQFEGIDKVLTSTDLMKNNYTKGVFQKIQKAYNQKRSGDIILHLKSGWAETGADRVMASSFHYDSHVPLIWYGWKIGRNEITGSVSVTDIMPTIGYFLNISRPPATQGSIIQELID